jgi:predicted Zn-dependent protease
MKRRRWLRWGCAHCAALAGLAAAQTEWSPPPRFERPDLAGDEGGLWAMMDREETRLRRSPFRIRDAPLSQYLGATACRLGGEHCPDIRVYPVRMPYFNANMAPNGMMQVWSGLLLRLENEAQLAAILAHEIGHYLQRHSLQRLRDAKARAAFATLLAGFGVYGLVGQLVLLGTAYAYSRDQEREADAISVVLMRRHGYDTREAPKVWANLLAETKAGKADENALDSILFATHPTSEERRQTLEREAAGGSGDVGTEAYRQRLAPLRFELLEDEVKRGRCDESLVLMNRLLGREPADAELLYFRGEMRRLRNADGDAAAALADFDAAAGTGSAPAVTWRSMGHLHLARRQTDAARAAWQRYLAAAPDAADAALIRQSLEQLR